MENQTINTSPAPERNSSANTVLLIVIIVIILGFGYWWYKHYNKAPVQNTPASVNITIPTSGSDSTNNNGN